MYANIVSTIALVISLVALVLAWTTKKGQDNNIDVE